ncbi:hypothetical protein G7054_g6810 [Neopestalotiopsis clavispora]|nr:hypothetical protein G7054_g6810 [Neopestalotiopsis clavispora]
MVLVHAQKSDMTNTSPYPVHQGYWVNWSRGRIFGATLTLTNTDGTLLIAFLAFFVTIVGAYLWRIFCFAMHQIYSRSNPSDALHHQRQAVLRNASKPTQGVTTFLQLLHAWRKKGKRPYGRIIPILVITLVIACGLAIVSGFSAKVVLGNEVLLNGEQCGWIDASLANHTENYLVIAPHRAKEQQIDSTYAQQCYADAGDFLSGSLGCNTYVTQQLPFNVTTNAGCPFPGDICVTNDSNIIIDSGYLDSHFDIGVNAPESERFKFRLVLECAPLQTEGYSSVYNMSRNRTATRYYYGESLLYNSNWTTQSSNDLYADEMRLHVMGSDYGINSYHVDWNGTETIGTTEFVPLPELTVRDATLYLIFLQANGVVSLYPIHDAWFKSTKVVGHDLDNNAKGYGQDTPASPMGCLLRHQYCNASGSCSLMDVNGGFPDAVRSIFPDESSYDRVAWFDELASRAFDLGPVVHGRNNLQARYGLFSGTLDEPLPDNQWQIEVAYWFSIMMASVQKSSVDTAAGSWNDALLPYIARPASPEQANACMSQKITSPYYTSFSMFGIMFIFTLGTIIIILGITLPSIVGFFQKRLKKDPHARLEWCANNTLQLQRLAHEELGLGKWSHGTKSIPMTKGDINLGVLDLSDLKHPRLMSQDSKKEDVVGIATPETAMEEETLVSEARVSLSTSRGAIEDTSIGGDEGTAANAEAQPPEEMIIQGRGGSQEIQRPESSSPPPN